MNDRYSYSMLRAYLTCPYAYKRHYIDGEKKDLSNHRSERGRRIHEFLAVALNGEDPEILSEQDALEYMVAVELCSSLRGGWKDLRIEERIEAVICDRMFVAVPDAVITFKDNTVSVVEFKTGGLPANALQCMIYALAVKQQRGRVDNVFYVTPNSVKNISVSQDMLHAYERVIRSVISKMEHDGEFKPRPSNACVACAHKDSCPFANTGVVRRYLELKNELNEMRNKLKEQLGGKMFEHDGRLIEFKNGAFSVVGEPDPLFQHAET